jgi:hypothetical protein
MPKHDDDQLDQCKSIFPTWTWLVGILSGSIVVIATCAFVYAAQETKQDSKLTDHETRIMAVEAIHNDLDTVKMLLRAR